MTKPSTDTTNINCLLNEVLQLTVRIDGVRKNLWVERECKRALKVSFSRRGTTVDGRGASNPTGSKIKALSCQKYLFIS